VLLPGPARHEAPAAADVHEVVAEAGADAVPGPATREDGVVPVGPDRQVWRRGAGIGAPSSSGPSMPTPVRRYPSPSSGSAGPLRRPRPPGRSARNPRFRPDRPRCGSRSRGSGESARGVLLVPEGRAVDRRGAGRGDPERAPKPAGAPDASAGRVHRGDGAEGEEAAAGPLLAEAGRPSEAVRRASRGVPRCVAEMRSRTVTPVDRVRHRDRFPGTSRHGDGRRTLAPEAACRHPSFGPSPRDRA
jgi:hypothetical protein